MTRPLLSLLVALVLTGGCADTGAGVTDLSDQAEDVAEQTRFCLSLARTLNAIEEGNNVATATQAAEETLTRAPERVKNAARAVVDHLRRAAEGEPAALRAPSFEASVDALRNDGLEQCDPTDPGP